MDLADVRCLSVKQPWAALIIYHGKDVENRTWRRSYTGPCFIHAGLRVDDVAMADPKLGGRCSEAELVTGGVIGMVDVTGYVDESDSPWFFGPYGYTLANPRPLPFVPMKGLLGFFAPTPEALAALGGPALAHHAQAGRSMAEQL